MKKQIFLLFLVVICCFGIIKGVYVWSDGFRLNKIALRPNDLSFEKKLSSIPENVKKILDQKFYYLSKGRQTYVFESEDGKYVLKLLRQHKYYKPLWAIFEKNFFGLTSFQKKVLKEKKERKKRAYESYELADKYLREKTGLIYVHIDEAFLNCNVNLIDRANRKFKLDLNNFHFFIQRKAFSLEKIIVKCQKMKNYDQIEALLISFMDLCLYRANKNIWNRDIDNYIRNSGYLDGYLVEMDIGSFYREGPPTTILDEKKRCKNAISKFVDNLSREKIEKILETKFSR